MNTASVYNSQRYTGIAGNSHGWCPLRGYTAEYKTWKPGKPLPYRPAHQFTDVVYF